MLFGAITVICFFYFSERQTKKWQFYRETTFLKKLFWTALVIRLLWVIFSYIYYEQMTGIPFEYHTADAAYYNDLAGRLADALKNGYFNYFNLIDKEKDGIDISDSGYPVYLAFMYLFTGKSILIARIIKALLSVWMCVLIYKLTKRNFGESTARMAGILCMLMPHFIYYCGLHLKETEMVFLTVAFVERADYLLRSKNYNFLNILIPTLLAGTLFFFRTVLGITALMAFFTAIVFSSAKIVGWGKRILIAIWVIAAVGYFMGGRIATEVEAVWLDRDESQQRSLEWRASEKNRGGNRFAKYAGTAIFAPIIFIIPFPTMIGTPEQENQQLMNGSNFVKNITAFFTMLGIFLLIYRKKWRENTLVLAFLIGYLVVTALSAFAQSERFHMPSLPFALIIAAYGISQMDRYKVKYFNLYIVLICIAIIGWSWFKLAGRGLA
jgi:4-amino-4-deoxy-L-arabinose transferase-like glycosyltransferase